MTTVIGLVLGLISVLMPLRLAGRHGLVRLASPLHLVAYLAFLGGFLKLVVYLFLPDAAFYRLFVTDDGAVLPGVLYYTLFILLLCGGYLAGIRRREPPHPLLVAYGVRAIRHPMVLAALGAGGGLVVASAYLTQHGLGGLGDALSLDAIHQLNSAKFVFDDDRSGPGSTFAGLQSLFVVTTFAFVAFLARQFVAPDGANLTIAIVLGGMCVAIVVLTGRRILLLDLVLICICVLCLTGARLDARRLGLLAVVGVAIFGLLLFMTTLRETRGAITASSFETLLLFEHLVGSTYFLDINNSIILVERFPMASYFWGESYLHWTYAWIPRQFWPEKPPVGLGIFLKEFLLGYRSVGAYNETGPGEAFMNFGWAGVFMGFCLGYLFRRLEEFMLSARMIANGGGIWLYALILLPMVKGATISNFSGVVVTLAVQAAVILLLLRLVAARLDVARIEARIRQVRA